MPEEDPPLEEVPQIGGGVPGNSEQVGMLVQFMLVPDWLQQPGGPEAPQSIHSPLGHLIFKPLVQAGAPLVQIAKLPLEEAPEVEEAPQTGGGVLDKVEQVA